jgi:DNA-binding response OmpR family regulator
VARLNAGDDDYILKPFELLEFEARLRAVLRGRGARDATRLSHADISFDTASRDGRIGDRRLDLTRREAALFEKLVRNGERPTVRDSLADRMYGIDDDVSRTVSFRACPHGVEPLGSCVASKFISLRSLRDSRQADIALNE